MNNNNNQKNKYTICLDECLPSRKTLFMLKAIYCHIPSFVLVPIMFEAVNDLIYEFSDSPEKYISARLREKIDVAVSEYLAA